MNTICLYLDNKDNCFLLKEMLQDSWRVVEACGGLPDTPFDICITDGITLDHSADILLSRKHSAAPLFLPILLLTAHPSPDLFSRDWWRLVDEVSLVPVRKALLFKRIEILFRVRAQSFDLLKEKEALAEAHAQVSLGMKTGKISYWQVELSTGSFILSEEWKAQLGCPAQFDNAQIELFRHIHPDDLESFRNMLLKIIENRSGSLLTVYRMSCFDNDYSWFLLRSTFVHDLQGIPVRLLISQIDITEQKTLELQCVEREKQFAEAKKVIQERRQIIDAILNYTPVGIILVDKAGCVIEANKTFTRMIGVPQSEIIGKEEQPVQWGIMEPHGRAIPPCATLPVYRAIHERKIIPPTEYLFKMNGKEKTFTLSSAPVFDNNSEVTGGISVWQDITERKQVENALRQSTKRYHTLFESIDQGYCVIQMLFDDNDKTIDFRFIEVNPSFYQQTGVRDIVGKTAHEIVPHAKNYWLDILGSVAITGQATRFQRRSELLQKWFDVYAYRFGNPEDRQVALLFTNITEKKNAEEELRKTHVLLRRITLDTEDMIAAQDKHFNYVFFNDAFHKVFKKLWNRDLTIGTNMLEALSPWPEELQKMVKMWSRAFNGESFRTIGEIGPTEGSKSFFDLQYSPLVDEKGEVYGASHIMRDVTEQMHIQETLQKRTEELAAANKSLEAFSYSVSHDLRNPLSIIGNFSDLLLEDYAERLDDEGRDYCKHIKDNVGKMTDIIEDMLTLSRIDRQELKCEDIDLSSLVHEILQELKHQATGRHVQFEVESNIHIQADPRLVHMAIENLLRNAWKFTSKRDITRIAFGRIILDGKSAFFIRDNGAGFDKKFAEKIFEPFKRVHAQKEFAGTGVGLSIVQRVISRHGGSVWAESDVNKGAVFYFTLG
jgi:PAS domain S-box-containing protein